jgi:hypothetical protein
MPERRHKPACHGSKKFPGQGAKTDRTLMPQAGDVPKRERDSHGYEISGLRPQTSVETGGFSNSEANPAATLGLIGCREPRLPHRLAGEQVAPFREQADGLLNLFCQHGMSGSQLLCFSNTFFEGGTRQVGVR